MSKTSPLVYFKLLLVAFFWGGTWIAGRVAVAEAPPLTVASWRFLFAVLLLGALLLKQEGRPRWNAGDWLSFALLGLSGIFLYNLFFLNALRAVEAGRGALVVAFIPALVALADWAFFKVPMTLRRALGVILAMSGCLLVVTQGDPARLLGGGLGSGEWMLIGTSLTWTAYTLISRRFAERQSPLALTFGACLCGWAMLTLAALLEGSLFELTALSWRGASGIAFLGLFGTAIAFTWYSEGINRIGSTRSAAFINLVPVFAVLLGALLLGERLASGVLTGGALVIAGVLLTSRIQFSLRETPQGARKI